MTAADSSTEDEKKVSRAFRDGVRRAYAKLFWALLDRKRGSLTKRAFAESVLQMQSSAITRGLDEGTLTLEVLLCIMAELQLRVTDLPELPPRLLLAAFGYQNIVNLNRFVATIEQVCLAIAAVPSRNVLAALTREISRASASQSEAVTKRFAAVEAEIINRASVLIESLQQYQQQMPEDCRGLVARSPPDIRAAIESYKQFSPALNRAIMMVQYNWIE